MTESFSKSKTVRSKLGANGYNVSQDVQAKLDRKIDAFLEESMYRAKENGRKTVQAKDL